MPRSGQFTVGLGHVVSTRDERLSHSLAIRPMTLPVGEVKDPGLLNVYFDEQPVPYDGKSGWTIDGTTITLNGVACDKVLTGQVLDVRVIGGCPTIIK